MRTNWAVAVLPSGHEYALEIASDEASRARGLMGRDRLEPRSGMLFVFDEDGREAFWMKNCKISLDMVWLDASFRVVFVAPDQKPCPESGECPSVGPLVPARYVLEFAAGTAAAERLAPGVAVTLLAEPALR
jgi:uncharacterized protein